MRQQGTFRRLIDVASMEWGSSTEQLNVYGDGTQEARIPSLFDLCLGSPPLSSIEAELNGVACNLSVRSVPREPQDVSWHNIQRWSSKSLLRPILGCLSILGCCLAMAVLVFVPVLIYMGQFFEQTGSLPSGVIAAIIGIVGAIANTVMCVALGVITSQCGIARKDRQHFVVFVIFCAICFWGFTFNVMQFVFSEWLKDPFKSMNFFVASGLPGTGDMQAWLMEVSFQMEYGAKLWWMIVPGYFIGYILWPLQGFVWPLLSDLAFMKCRYRKSCNAIVGGAFLTARAAEKKLEPFELGLANDYAGHIIQPLQCSLILFFGYAEVWTAFLWLAIWSFCSLAFQRWLHLRLVKKSYFSTNRLDTLVQYVWGMPLSTVLAASAFWTARLRGWPMIVVPVVWIIGWILWCLSLKRFIKPLRLAPISKQQPSYDEVRRLRFYSWENCNPMKVLLSHCMDNTTPIMPYVTGKHYFQVIGNDATGARHRLRTRTMGSMAKMQTVATMGGSMEIESLLQKPYNAAADAGNFVQRLTTGCCNPVPNPSSDVADGIGVVAPIDESVNSPYSCSAHAMCGSGNTEYVLKCTVDRSH